MHAANDFDSSDTGEQEFYQFDFSTILATGETLSSVVWTCIATVGIDPSAASRLSGGPITTPTNTTQLVFGLLGGVTYELRAMATTSAGQILSLWAHVSCVTPN